MPLLVKKIFLFLLFLTLSTTACPEKIIPLHNIDPAEWEHVHINTEKFEHLAFYLSNDQCRQVVDWKQILPPGLDFDETVNYVLGLISIDFCHWAMENTPEGLYMRNFYVDNGQKERLRGSAAMTELIKRAYQNGMKLFDATAMKEATVAHLRPYFLGVDSNGIPMEIPALEKRIQVMSKQLLPKGRSFMVSI